MAKRDPLSGPGARYEPGERPGSRMTVDERANTMMSVCSPEVREAMRKEDAFIASVTGRPNEKVFTKRGAPPMRKDLIP